MKNVALGLIVGILLMGNVGLGQYSIINYDRYMLPHNPIIFPTYMNYLKLGTIPMATSFHFIIRQGSIKYPGDYFYPPDAYIPKEFMAKDLYAEPTQSEINTVKEFLSIRLSSKFSDSLILSSLKCYNFAFRNGLHREPYTMFSKGDTVYVISGWLGKFLSFYRAVPGGFRMTVPELMKQLGDITPLSRNIKEGAFMQQLDSLNYLLEYVDKDKMLRVRNYLMKTILPPEPTDSPERLYNLIEITRFYDKEAIP